MKKYRFKSENHKQEFASNCFNHNGDEDLKTYNQAVIEFLDAEGLDEFYIDNEDDEAWIMVDGSPAIIMHFDAALLFHLYNEDIQEYMVEV